MKRTTRRIIKSKSAAAEAKQKKQLRNKRIKQGLMVVGGLVALRFLGPLTVGRLLGGALLPMKGASA